MEFSRLMSLSNPGTCLISEILPYLLRHSGDGQVPVFFAGKRWAVYSPNQMTPHDFGVILFNWM
jgi:hypothetical protein